MVGVGTALSAAEEELDALEAAAPALLTTGRPAVLADRLDRLLAADLARHPLACLAVAAACHDLRRGDPRAAELVVRAKLALERAGDTRGLGLAANVQANLSFARGDLDEAFAFWRQCRDLLPATDPIAAGALAHLSLESYRSGNLRDAVVRARKSLNLAMASHRVDLEITPRVYLGLYHLNDGQLATAEEELRAAEQAWSSPDSAGDRNEGPLVLALIGCLHAIRHDEYAAEESFGRALRLAEELDAPWYAAMARCMRAEFCAAWSPVRSLDDARTALRQAVTLGDEWWVALSVLAEGVALREAGRLEESALLLPEAVESLSNPLERGRALLAWGETELARARRDEAVNLLRSALDIFEMSGARYHETRCCVRLAEAARDRGALWRSRARGAATADVAFDWLLGGAGSMLVSLVGRGSVRVAGREATFVTRHAELAVYLLALAGSDGIAAEALAAALWPEAAPDRRPPRLRTLLWQVRNGLGSEAWRLERRGGRVRLDLDGVEVERDAGLPLLDGWEAADLLTGLDLL